MPSGDLLVRDLMSRSVVSVTPDSTVSQALATMSGHGIHEVPVLSDSTLVGWVSYDEILRRMGLAKGAKVTAVMSTPPRAAPEEDAVEAAARMVESHARALPVVDSKGHVVGILSRTDLLRAAQRMDEVASLRLDKVMTRDLEVVGRQTPLDEVEHRLKTLHVNQLLVTDPKGALLGSIGVEEVAEARVRESSGGITSGHAGGSATSGAGRQNTRKIAVEGLVRPAPRLPPAATIADAIRRMQESKATFVAVVDGNDLPVGIVSRFDILQRVAALRPAEGVLVQISGLQGHADASVYDAIYAKARSSLKKIAQEMPIEFFSLHFKIYKDKSEGDSKFSLTAHLATERQLMVAKADGWDLLVVVDEAFEVLEQRSRNVKELRLERRKAGPRRAIPFYT